MGEDSSNVTCFSYGMLTNTICVNVIPVGHMFGKSNRRENLTSGIPVIKDRESK